MSAFVVPDFPRTSEHSYNPASQIATNTRSNDAYSWTGHGSGTIGSTANGLNQLTQQGGAAITYDGRGNLTNDGAGRTFVYTSENRLASGPGTNQYYDALGRLFHLSGSGVNLHHDGDAVIEEFQPDGRAVSRSCGYDGLRDDGAAAWAGAGGAQGARALSLLNLT